MKEKIITVILTVGLIVLLLFGMVKLAGVTHPTTEIKVPFTIVCKIGNREESFPAISYMVADGACTFTTDSGEKIVVSDFAIFVNEPYYKKD